MKKILFLVAFVYLSILRFHNYDRIPGPNHAEELLYGWSGIYLWETGVPVSWSSLPYPDKYLVFDGPVGSGPMAVPAKLYRPWLDEPPLYSLLSGGMAYLYGDPKTAPLPTSHTRIPSVILGTLTAALIFLVGKRFFSFWVGFTAMVIYGATPLFVFASRLSVPENLTACAVLLVLYFTPDYLKKPRLWFPFLCGLCSAILGLAKPTGFFLAPLAIFISLLARRPRHIFLTLTLTLTGVLIFVWYGYHYDWELFKWLVSIQGVRFAGWSGLGHIFTSPAYDIFNFYDGWYIFCFIFALFFSLQKNHPLPLKLLSVFFWFWLLVAVFSGTEQDLLPWYRYPFFPLLSLFGALGLRHIWRNPTFIPLAFSFGLLLTTRFYLSNAFRPTTPPNTFRITYLLLLSPALLYMLWPKPVLKKISRVIFVLFVLLGLYYNSKYIYSVFEIRCESISCPFGPSTTLSETRLPFFWRYLVMPDPAGLLDTNRPKF